MYDENYVKGTVKVVVIITGKDTVICMVIITFKDTLYCGCGENYI